jgi:hypothetical protein
MHMHLLALHYILTSLIKVYNIKHKTFIRLQGPIFSLFFPIIFLTTYRNNMTVCLLFNIKTIPTSSYLLVWLNAVIILGKFWPLENEKTSFTRFLESCEVSSPSNIAARSGTRLYK